MHVLMYLGFFKMWMRWMFNSEDAELTESVTEQEFVRN